MICSILGLAASLNAHVVAEGVEHGRDFKVLRELGVSLVQGFLFAPPRQASSFSEEDLVGLHRLLTATTAADQLSASQ